MCHILQPLRTPLPWPRALAKDTHVDIDLHEPLTTPFITEIEPSSKTGPVAPTVVDVDLGNRSYPIYIRFRENKKNP
ncbi:unnamed protein product [Malus baccata var. baccata]